MSSHHGWSGDPAIWAAIQLPVAGALGVVICTPLGQEGVVAYRGLRFLAAELEQRGIASVRYDPPGRGDGAPSADPLAPIQGARRAADLLRQAGCSQIAFVGLSSAALIASEAAAERDILVLWSPPASGRIWLRRSRSLATIMMGSDRQSGQTESLIGLDLTAEQAEALGRLQVRLPGGAPALVANRPGEPVRPELAEAEITEVRGTAEFLDTSSVSSVMPTEAIATIVDWLAAQAVPASTPLVPPPLAQELDLGESIERIHWIGPHQLFGIEATPREVAAEAPVVLLHAGASEHRVGAGDYQVELARLLAGDGVRSFRVDRRSTGETGEISDHEPSLLYTKDWVEDQDTIIEAIGVSGDRLVLTGLCAGGWVAAQRAMIPPRLVVQIHPMEYRLEPALPNEFVGAVPPEPSSQATLLVRQLYRRWAPIWLRRLRARSFGQVEASPYLLETADRVERTVLIFSEVDHEVFRRMGGIETARRLPNIETVELPTLDHPLFARRTRERVFAEVRRQVAEMFGLPQSPPAAPKA